MFLPRLPSPGGTTKDCTRLMSSLDIGTSQRAAIKRRLSDSNRAVHSTKLKPSMRIGSLSPTNDVS